MKKNDFIIVAILVVMMFGWMKYYPAIEKKYFPRPEQPVVEKNVEAVSPPPSPVEKIAPVLSAPATGNANLLRQGSGGQVGTSRLQEEQAELAPERFQTLENDQMELTVSSHGGAVISAVLKDYPELNKKDSGPVILDFSAVPALRYDGLPLSGGTLEYAGEGLRYTAPMGDDRVFQRTVWLEGEYLLMVEDSFINHSEIPWVLPGLRLPTGPMSNPTNTTSMRGLSTLGVDAFSSVDGVSHWGKKFRKIGKGLQEFTSTPVMVAPRPVDWIATKNKFFVQILTPEGGAAAFDLSVRRSGEGKKMVPSEVSAALQFGEELIGANETFTRSTRAYIGPKDFGFLKTQGMEQTEVMEFKSIGFWKFMNPVMYPIKKALLWGLIHFAPFGNYGIAILILTVLIRMIFWPLTHKGTESMKRMQALQPKMKAIKEKYKDNPQRQQQETMALYKENKVNPMGGCLPMFIQIPVFIALFAVLRSAIELRFSGFLWISDLSEPENLFAGMIPIVGSLNILPLLMSATMMWQQKLTPTAGDAQQQKMMAIMMPVMMLFFFYSMPSGLVLYWTTSQVLMIAQMLIKKKKEA